MGTFQSQKCSPRKQFGKHCIRVMATRISRGVCKCSVPSCTTTDPEREEQVVLFHGPSTTNKFCAALFTLKALATRFMRRQNSAIEQRVAPFDCDRCAKTKRLGIIPKQNFRHSLKKKSHFREVGNKFLCSLHISKKTFNMLPFLQCSVLVITVRIMQAYSVSLQARGDQRVPGS